MQQINDGRKSRKSQYLKDLESLDSEIQNLNMIYDQKQLELDEKIALNPGSAFSYYNDLLSKYRKKNRNLISRKTYLQKQAQAITCIDVSCHEKYCVLMKEDHCVACGLPPRY